MMKSGLVPHLVVTDHMERTSLPSILGETRKGVLINIPAGRDIVGLESLKGWLNGFISSFRPRIDLIDHYVAGDRALVTINLHWKHDGTAPQIATISVGSISQFAAAIHPVGNVAKE
jgi:hypothetical protein